MAKIKEARPEEWATILTAALSNAASGVGPFVLKRSLKRLPATIEARTMLGAIPDVTTTACGGAAAEVVDTVKALRQAFDVEALHDELIDRCDEFEAIAGHPVAFAWLRANPLKQGDLVLGRAKAVPQRERDLWTGPGPVPLWWIELALPTWLCMGPMERRRLLHHEMSHLAVEEAEVEDEDGCTVRTYRARTVGHDIEEMRATMGRFGLASEAQALVVAAAMAHPSTSPRLKEWAVDPKTGQGLLFGPYGQGTAADADADA